MRFVFCTLAAVALVVLATDVGQGATAAGSRSSSQGATAGSRLSSKKPPAGTTPVESTLARLFAKQMSKPKVALRKGATHARGEAGDAHKRAEAGDAHKRGEAGDAQKGGLVAAAAEKGGAPAPAFNMTGAGSAARVPPAIPGPQGLHGAAAAAAATPGGAVSGVSIKPHPSALVALGGAVTGKGTAQISGANVRPKSH